MSYNIVREINVYGKKLYVIMLNGNSHVVDERDLKTMFGRNWKILGRRW